MTLYPLKKIIFTLALCIGLSIPVQAGQAIRTGIGSPIGIFGEYEYKILFDQVGLFAHLGGYSGDMAIPGQPSTEVNSFAWGIGARVYLPLGFHVRGGLSGLSVDGTSTDTITTNEVDSSATVTGLDIAIGYELHIGPLFVGLDGGVILAQPTVTNETSNPVSGGISESYKLDNIPHFSLFGGIRF